jgi:hypothetical protein
MNPLFGLARLQRQLFAADSQQDTCHGWQLEHFWELAV